MYSADFSTPVVDCHFKRCYTAKVVEIAGKALRKYQATAFIDGNSNPRGLLAELELKCKTQVKHSLFNAIYFIIRQLFANVQCRYLLRNFYQNPNAHFSKSAKQIGNIFDGTQIFEFFEENYLIFFDKCVIMYKLIIEAWLSLVERCVRDAEAVGSNPVASTKMPKDRIVMRSFIFYPRIFPEETLNFICFTLLAPAEHLGLPAQMTYIDGCMCQASL